MKPLEKLDVISEKNKKQLHDFIIWLTDNNDYSSHTVDIYYTSMKKYFEYANEVNMDNCRRFIKSLENLKEHKGVHMRVMSCFIESLKTKF